MTDCRVIADEHMTMQYKPHVSVTRMQMRREIMVGGGQGGRRTYEDTTDILRNMLYADDLAVVAGGATDLQEQLIERKDILSSTDCQEEDQTYHNISCNK